MSTPAGHVRESVLSEYGKSPSAAGLSHLGCAHEGMTYSSDNFRCWLARHCVWWRRLCLGIKRPRPYLHLLSLPSVVPC